MIVLFLIRFFTVQILFCCCLRLCDRALRKESSASHTRIDAKDKALPECLSLVEMTIRSSGRLRKRRALTSRQKVDRWTTAKSGDKNSEVDSMRSYLRIGDGRRCS